MKRGGSGTDEDETTVAGLREEGAAAEKKRAELDIPRSGKQSRTKTAVWRFDSPTQVDSGQTMATAVVDSGDGKNPLSCLVNQTNGGAARGRKRS
jgi:hypothetical protein